MSSNKAKISKFFSGTSLNLLTLVTLFQLTACSGGDSANKTTENENTIGSDSQIEQTETTQKIHIDSYKQSCEKDSYKLCYRIKIDGEQDFSQLIEDIDGLDYEWGHSYIITTQTKSEEGMWVKNIESKIEDPIGQNYTISYSTLPPSSVLDNGPMIDIDGQKFNCEDQPKCENLLIINEYPTNTNIITQYNGNGEIGIKDIRHENSEYDAAITMHVAPFRIPCETTVKTLCVALYHDHTYTPLYDSINNFSPRLGSMYEIKVGVKEDDKAITIDGSNLTYELISIENQEQSKEMSYTYYNVTSEDNIFLAKNNDYFIGENRLECHMDSQCTLLSNTLESGIKADITIAFIGDEKIAIDTWVPSNAVDESEIIDTSSKITIQSYPVVCQKTSEMLCLKSVSEKGGDILFYNDIEGFNYNWGYTYTLTIKTETDLSPAQDSSTIKHSLINIVSKKEDPIGTTYTLNSISNPSSVITQESDQYQVFGFPFECGQDVNCDNLINTDTSPVTLKFTYAGENKIILTNWQRSEKTHVLDSKSTHQDNSEKPQILVLDHATVCTSSHQQSCLKIQSTTEGNTSLLYEKIEGFDYIWGYEYTLTIDLTAESSPAEDQSSISYTLLSIDSKKESTIGKIWKFKNVNMDGAFYQDSNSYYFYGYQIVLTEDQAEDVLSSKESYDIEITYLGDGKIALTNYTAP